MAILIRGNKPMKNQDNIVIGGQPSVRWKGIILTAGAGTRLYPSTLAVNKQLLSVYDKPMIYYPLSILMLAGIREIMIITTETDLNRFKSLLGDGYSLGISISYAIQHKPVGIPQAFTIGREFIGKDNVCLILGDNVFYGDGLAAIFRRVVTMEKGGLIFGCRVKDPERYGVVEFDKDGKVISVEEKPARPKSHYAVPGLYFFDNRVVDMVLPLKPSARGELEIADIILEYLRNGELKVERLGRGFAWLDTGTHDSLLAASMFIETIEKRQGLKVACIEEVAYKMGYIDINQLRSLAEPLQKSGYGKYILQMLSEQEEEKGSVH